MSRITVLRPDTEASTVARGLAPRTALPARPVVGLIANGKPFARELLSLLAAEFADRLGREVDVELLAKPSAGHAIEPAEARRMAARCHVLVSGLGD